MALKTVNEESLVALGDAIRGKTGGEETLNFPDGMVDAINGLSTKSGSMLPAVIDGSITELTEEDFGDATSVRVEAFWQCANLTTVLFPDTITHLARSAFSGCSKLSNVKMSKNISYIGEGAFDSCSKLSTIRFEGDNVPEMAINQNPISFPSTTTLEVPGKLYDEYLNTDIWGTTFRTQLLPYDKYANTLIPKTILEYNSSKTFSITLQNYTETPNVEIISNNLNVVEVMLNNIDTNEILFSIFSLSTEGSTTIEVRVSGEDDYVFIRQMEVEVWAELLPSSYNVEDVGTTYGFTINDDGYYESNNKGKSSTFAYCKINISNTMGLPVYIDCISYGENNYDYGLFSAVNADLTKATSDGIYLHSFKGRSSSNVQTLEYLDAVGDCYITVKYKKDGSGDNYNDTLQFKVRFGE